MAKSTGVLSPRLATLAKPAVHEGSARAQAQALDVPTDGAGALIVDSRDRVLVLVRLTDTTPSTVAPFATLGEVVNVSEQMSRLTLRIAPANLPRLAAQAGVVYADVIPAPRRASESADGTSLRTSATTAGGSLTTSGAAVQATDSCATTVSEADTQLRAAEAREDFGVDGTGVKVGILSDSYDAATLAPTRAARDILTGDLPGPGNPCGRTSPVTVVEEIAQPRDEDDNEVVIDEGRAMAQLVHDLAPGAGLSFASAFNGQDAFANSIRGLADRGAGVIVDDVSYFSEPFFQSGVIDQAVTDVTSRGVSYFSSAGNSNVIFNGKNVSSWETPAKRSTPCPSMFLPDGAWSTLGNCVDFDPAGGGDSTYGITVANGGRVAPILQWAEPQNAVTQDFDVLLLDAANGNILAASWADNTLSGSAYEYLSWQNTTGSAKAVQVVISHYSYEGAETPKPRLKLIFQALSGLTSLEYTESAGADIVGPTVYGHNGGRSTISVGAVPYDNSGVVEQFSSRGPVTHYFAPSQAGGSASLAVPRVITAPAVAATDGAVTTFFAQQIAGKWRFYGTSAAAPHAAAVAALMLAREPTLSPAQIRSRLRASAAPVGTAPATAVGAGLVDAHAALRLGGPPSVNPPVVKPTPPSAPRVTKTVAGRARAVVSFTAPASTGGVPITAYTATCRSGNGVTRAVTRESASTAPITVSRLTTGVKYRCGVTVRNAGLLASTGATGALVVPTGVAKAPTRVKAKAGKRKATVRFTAPSNTGGLRITGYKATCRPVKAGKGKVRSASAKGAKVTVRKLTKGVKYRCTVVTKNALGQSGASKKSKKVTVKR